MVEFFHHSTLQLKWIGKHPRQFRRLMTEITDFTNITAELNMTNFVMPKQFSQVILSIIYEMDVCKERGEGMSTSLNYVHLRLCTLLLLISIKCRCVKLADTHPYYNANIHLIDNVEYLVKRAIIRLE